MSANEISAVRRFYDDFASGAFAKAAEQITEDFELVNPLPEPIPFGGRFVGRDGFFAYLAGFDGVIEILEFEVDEVFGSDGRITVTGRERSRVVPTQREYTMEWVHVVGLRDGRVASLREYNDTAAMRAAFVEEAH